MGLIKDSNGEDLTYWPISGLVEGEASEILEFTIPTPQSGELYAEADPRVEVMCREKDVGAFQDISQNYLDVSTMATDPSRQFEIYIQALSPITGLERIPIAVGVGTTVPAGWLV